MNQSDARIPSIINPTGSRLKAISRQKLKGHSKSYFKPEKHLLQLPNKKNVLRDFSRARRPLKSITSGWDHLMRTSISTSCTRAINRNKWQFLECVTTRIVLFLVPTYDGRQSCLWSAELGI